MQHPDGCVCEGGEEGERERDGKNTQVCLEILRISELHNDIIGSR